MDMYIEPNTAFMLILGILAAVTLHWGFKLIHLHFHPPAYRTIYKRNPKGQIIEVAEGTPEQLRKAGIL